MKNSEILFYMHTSIVESVRDLVPDDAANRAVIHRPARPCVVRQEIERETRSIKWVRDEWLRGIQHAEPSVLCTYANRPRTKNGD